MLLYEKKKFSVESELHKRHYIKISCTFTGFTYNNKNIGYRERTFLILPLVMPGIGEQTPLEEG
jgi:hypothetical protein